MGSLHTYYPEGGFQRDPRTSACGKADEEALRSLIDLCIAAVCKSDVWRLQRRKVERLPEGLAAKIFHWLLKERRLSPPALEIFQQSVEDMDLCGASFVDASWLAYIGGFKHLRTLSLDGCSRVTDAALWHLAGLPRLETITLNCCSKVTDVSVYHLLSISCLQLLDLSQTSVSAQAAERLGSLHSLTHLSLGDIPVTDATVFSFQNLKSLTHLELWGSRMTDYGAQHLPQLFPALRHLSLAWTPVTAVPFLPHLTALDMSSCTITALCQSSRDCNPSQLEDLNIAGSCLGGESRRLLAHPKLTSINISGTDVSDLTCLADATAPTGKLTSLKASNLSIGNFGLANLVSKFPEDFKDMSPLTHLDLGGCSQVGTEGVAAILRGRKLGGLTELGLGGTGVGDEVLEVLTAELPVLRGLDLSATRVKGTPSSPSGVSPLVQLAIIPTLVSLNLKDTAVDDVAICHLAAAPGLQLSSLQLRGEFLTDASLQGLGRLRSLATLVLQNAVLTRVGLHPLRRLPFLTTLDLSGCWLLTSQSLEALTAKRPNLRVQHESLDGRGSPSKEAKKGVQQAQGSASKGRRKSRGSEVTPTRSRAAVLDERIRYTYAELKRYQGGAAPSDWSGWPALKQCPALIRGS